MLITLTNIPPKQSTVNGSYADTLHCIKGFVSSHGLIHKQSLWNCTTRWMLLNAASQLPGFINVTDRLKRLIVSVSQSKQAQILNTFMP